MMEPSYAQVRSLFLYDPEMGILQWRLSGRVAGAISQSRGAKYLSVSIKNKLFKAHRLIWLYMTGQFPAAHIDHRDGDGLNNRWDNLRAATRFQNLQNCKRHSRNTSGYKGVFRDKGKWVAAIQSNGVKHRIGSFATTEEAAAAYAKKALELNGEFARLA